MRFYNSGRYDTTGELLPSEPLLPHVLLPGKVFLFCNTRFISSLRVAEVGREEEEVLHAAQGGHAVLRLCANFAHGILEPVPHSGRSFASLFPILPRSLSEGALCMCVCVRVFVCAHVYVSVCEGVRCLGCAYALLHICVCVCEHAPSFGGVFV